MLCRNCQIADRDRANRERLVILLEARIDAARFLSPSTGTVAALTTPRQREILAALDLDPNFPESLARHAVTPPSTMNSCPVT